MFYHVSLFICNLYISSDGSTVPYSESTVPRKDNNWRTLVINANSIANKKAELAAIAEYCDPDLMLISETKLSPDILNGEFVPEGYGYMGRFRKDLKSSSIIWNFIVFINNYHNKAPYKFI